MLDRPDLRGVIKTGGPVKYFFTEMPFEGEKPVWALS